MADSKTTQNKNAPAKKAAAKKPQEIEALMIRSRSPQGAFRRAGLTFGTEPTVIALEALTEAQIATLEAEPMLVVERVGVPADEIEDGSTEAEDAADQA